MQEGDGAGIARQPAEGNHEWTRMDTNENKQVGRSGVRASQTQSNQIKVNQANLILLNRNDFFQPRMDTNTHQLKPKWFCVWRGPQKATQRWFRTACGEVLPQPCSFVSIRVHSWLNCMDSAQRDVAAIARQPKTEAGEKIKITKRTQFKKCGSYCAANY